MAPNNEKRKVRSGKSRERRRRLRDDSERNRKEKQVIKLINDMTSEEQQDKRKKRKEHATNSRQNKAILKKQYQEYPETEVRLPEINCPPEASLAIKNEVLLISEVEPNPVSLNATDNEPKQIQSAEARERRRRIRKDPEQRRQRLAKERERRRKIREDPEKCKIQKEKDRQRYFRKKEKQIIKLIKDMTPQEKCKKRAKWKLCTKNSRENKAFLKKQQQCKQVETQVVESSTSMESVPQMKDLHISEVKPIDEKDLETNLNIKTEVI
ncbi:uncharacterized protein LOC129909235 [Episyrphus balteatus]|uniref:uncharacterized protein LOC129909235 n=1 Tax=Episyrphus balteatus TaxID=286459 RepID=UPI00248524DC|nr:uncharacterized protein LOC129909235 [Episyrphus balteatus]